MHAPTVVERHATDTDSLTVAVVSAVAESKGVPTESLPPTVDVQADGTVSVTEPDVTAGTEELPADARAD
jgi:hypothetical protein